MISADQLRAHVGFEDLLEPVSRVLQESSAGLADNGMITLFPAARNEMGDVYVKAASVKGHGIYIVKVSPWFALNIDKQRAQGGFIAVFDAATGHTLALLHEEHYLSDIRTAASGALAARALAPARVSVAGVLGTGVQAYWQALALYRERPYGKLLVWGRDAVKAQALARRLQHKLPAVAVQVASGVQAVVEACDVLITATLAREPLVRGEWLHAGQHITAVGADDHTKVELDTECLLRANLLVVDTMAGNLQNGDILRAVQSGNFSATGVHGEFGDVLAGKLPGRQSANDITIAKFIGIGAQDLAAAEVALQKILAVPA